MRQEKRLAGLKDEWKSRNGYCGKFRHWACMREQKPRTKELQPEQRKVIDFEKCLYYNLQVGY